MGYTLRMRNADPRSYLGMIYHEVVFSGGTNAAKGLVLFDCNRVEVYEFGLNDGAISAGTTNAYFRTGNTPGVGTNIDTTSSPGVTSHLTHPYPLTAVGNSIYRPDDPFVLDLTTRNSYVNQENRRTQFINLRVTPGTAGAGKAWILFKSYQAPTRELAQQ